MWVTEGCCRPALLDAPPPPGCIARSRPPGGAAKARLRRSPCELGYAGGVRTPHRAQGLVRQGLVRPLEPLHFPSVSCLKLKLFGRWAMGEAC